MRNPILKLAPFLMLIVLTSFMGVVLHRSLEIHLNERNWFIKKDEFLNGSANHIFSIWKYTSSLDLFNDRLTQEEYDQQQFEAHFLMNLSPDEVEPLGGKDLIDQVSMGTINLLRWMTQKPPLPEIEESKVLYQLYGAVYLIIHKKYGHALEILKQLQLKDIDSTYKYHIELHIAFCEAMLGNEDEAISMYQAIIQASSYSPESYRARKLLFEIKARKEALKSIEDQSQSDQLISQAILFDCAKVLNTSENDISSKTHNLLHYSKGLCYYEKAQPQKGSRSMVKALLKTQEVDQAKTINRQLFIHTQQDPALVEFKKISQEMNQVLKDTTLAIIQKLETHQKMEQNKALASANDLLGKLGIQTTSEKAMPNFVIPKQKLLQKAKRLKAPKRIPKVEKPKRKKVKKLTQKPSNNNSKVVINTLSGQTFTGILKSSAKAKMIKLKTLVGIVRIPQSQVKSLVPKRQ